MSVNPFTPRPWKHQSSHPLDQILSDIDTGVQTRSKLKNLCAFYAFLSNIEPKNVNEAIADSDWITEMQEELYQFKRNKVCTLYHGQRIDQQLAPSGCSGTSLMSSEQSLGTRPGWWFKGTTKKRELTNPLVLKTM